jgi:hypothetical protein
VEAEAATEHWTYEPAIGAVAEALASINGKDEAFERERRLWFRGPSLGSETPDYTGTFKGCMDEAREMIIRLRQRGFIVVALPPAP